MATIEAMSIDERYQYLKRMQSRYRQADRQTKKELLDEMEAYTGVHRKSLIRRLKSNLTRKPRSRERERSYGPEVDEAMLTIWEALDYVCPRRLQPSLVSTGELLAAHGELHWSPHLAEKLGAISVSTVRRHLPSAPTTHRRRKPKAPENRHQQKIPAYRIPRDIAEPGHFEMDLVHHSGAVTEGEYIYTLQLVDVATGWSCRRAILGRSYVVMRDALAYLLPRLPFPVHELHPDNGSEFLNDHVLHFLDHDYKQIFPSRSRPATPNDNRLVEQKNGSLVRHYLGDRRYDTVKQTRYLNTVYEDIERFHNFIQPVMKQIDKEWRPPNDTRKGYVKRTHDIPRPPVDRLCEIWGKDTPKAQALLTQRAQINPLQLRRAIYRALDHFFAYPNAIPGHVENVFETLADPDRFPDIPSALQAVDTGDKPDSGLTPVPTASTTTKSNHFSRKETA
jgi:hypothetical protein